MITAAPGMYRRDVAGEYHLVVLWDDYSLRNGLPTGVTVSELNGIKPPWPHAHNYTTDVPKGSVVHR